MVRLGFSTSLWHDRIVTIPSPGTTIVSCALPFSHCCTMTWTADVLQCSRLCSFIGLGYVGCRSQVSRPNRELFPFDRPGPIDINDSTPFSQSGSAPHNFVQPLPTLVHLVNRYQDPELSLGSFLSQRARQAWDPDSHRDARALPCHPLRSTLRVFSDPRVSYFPRFFLPHPQVASFHYHSSQLLTLTL